MWVWRDGSPTFALPKFHRLGEVTWWNHTEESCSKFFSITEMKENKSLHLGLFANLHLMQH